ncbi:uncharacterized protein ACA1_306550 [Acanthamoeba castellanii str. Neff]|uniref:Uncharacterized protein n=1 Tax=Acanthamoeba castellanii (strain ATCC 30010 / Neff) TaxID=1257118 RepID=L8HC69_ACACF|nr:uncharacterized protein ACA1_306550 [Acanthamoeba castellanii str. Neff]ELR23099.1 hypothetical protein ACA1_306550 [Acanthamoeba castellanii str. Neff]
MCMNYFASVAEVEKNKAKLTELTIPETQEQEAKKIAPLEPAPPWRCHKICLEHQREEQVTLPTAMVTDEELLKLLKEPTEEELSMPPEEALLKCYDCFAAVLTTNVLEMAALLNLLANENSPWQLLHLISGSIPNIRSKSAGGVQHNGLYTIFIGQVNKSYTFNPESLLIQDITKIPKLMAYKKPSLIKRWNPNSLDSGASTHLIQYLNFFLTFTPLFHGISS